ncbi:MAG: hypothetical protein M1839_004784 [Geoglossum umbratile]|nr:MAG: hypothetical protein M1839_004784 [Geoglossum umbratile]
MSPSAAYQGATQPGERLVEVNEIVRRFSYHVKGSMPAEPLAQALAKKETFDEEQEKKRNTLVNRWQSLFMDHTGKVLIGTTEGEQALESESQELAKAWCKFQGALPKEHRSRVQDAPPDIATVIKAVQAARASWQKSREQKTLGKTKKLFVGVCQSLDHHKELFGMIPNNDKYICLVTGSISAIIKATVNHEDIAERISQNLDDIGEDIEYMRRQMKVHLDNDLMERYVAKFYVIFFRFLVGILTNWYRSGFQRFRHSFDNKFFENQVAKSRSEMKDLSERLDREAKLATEARIKEAPTKAEITEILSQFSKHYQLVLGSLVQTSRREEARRIFEEFDRGLDNTQGSLGSAEIEETKAERGTNTEAKDVISPEQNAEESARRLDNYLQDDYVTELIDRVHNLSINREVFLRIQQWASEPRSESIWIDGPFRVPVPSQATLTSASIVSTVRRMGIPVIAYFCRHERQDNKRYRSSDELVRLTYALIRQLVPQLPTTPETPLDLSPTRFEPLDGSLRSMPEAISLLADLLAAGPALLFCIVDGIQILDDGKNAETTAHLRGLINVLCDAGMAVAESSRIVNVYFGTDGYTEVLGFPASKDKLGRSSFSEVGRLAETDHMAFLM